jgi:hypothetical protein
MGSSPILPTARRRRPRHARPRHLLTRRQKQLAKARNDRWIVDSECGTVTVLVKVTRAMVEEQIDLGVLLENESESREEIAKAFITEHQDLVALSKDERFREFLKELKKRRV